MANKENVKMFDPLGKFLYSLCPDKLKLNTGILATDRNDNLYLCFEWIKKNLEICVFDRNHELHYRFSLRAAASETQFLTISNDDQVFVVVRYGRYGSGVYQVYVLLTALVRMYCHRAVG